MWMWVRWSGCVCGTFDYIWHHCAPTLLPQQWLAVVARCRLPNFRANSSSQLRIRLQLRLQIQNSVPSAACCGGCLLSGANSVWLLLIQYEKRNMKNLKRYPLSLSQSSLFPTPPATHRAAERGRQIVVTGRWLPPCPHHNKYTHTWHTHTLVHTGHRHAHTLTHTCSVKCKVKCGRMKRK